MLLNAPGGDITFLESGDDGFTWPLPSGAGAAGGEPASIISFEVARSCNHSGEDEGVIGHCAEVPGGFPVVGRLDLGIDTDTYEATLDVNVRVGIPLEVTGRIAPAGERGARPRARLASASGSPTRSSGR